MDEYGEIEQLSITLKAISDETRRSLLTSLVQEGPIRVTDLAKRYEMSLNAVSKHIKVLESAGLITRRTFGRVHMIEAELQRIQLVEQWFKDLRGIWDIRLEHLSKVLENKETGED